MANFRSICIIIFLFILINLSAALFEDQVGKFDWKKSYVGKVKYAHFDSKRVIVATEENVLASLNLKTGQILWRQLLENPNEQEIELLHVDNEITTISGSQNSWFIRNWDLNNGVLLSEWTIYMEKIMESKWIVNKNQLIQIVPVLGSHLEVTAYQISNGENQGKTTKITAPWVNEHCAISKSVYACLTVNANNIYNLLYIDLSLKESELKSQNVQNLVGEGSGSVHLISFDDTKPAFLITRGVKAKLVYLGEDNVSRESFDLMSNAIGVSNDNRNVIYQLEANLDNPNKLIVVKCKNPSNGEEELSVEIEYPLGLGAPYIVDGQCKGYVCDLLLSSTDSALSVVRLPEGKILWTREEALSNIVATKFFELPVSELDASIEKEFDTSNGVIGMLIHRLSTQAKQLYSLLFGGQLLSSNALVRDEFGLHKIIVVATKVGKVFGIDTLTGSIVWSYRLPNIKPFWSLKQSKMFLLVQRTARYAPLPAQCVLLAKDMSTDNGILFQFDPITGISINGIEKLNYGIKQALILPFEVNDNIKPIIIYSDNNRVFVYPEYAKNSIEHHLPNTYMYTVDSRNTIFQGYNFYNNSGNIVAKPTWKIDLSPAQLLALSAKSPNERVHSQGRVLPDRSVYYKYVNPNLIAVATINDDPIHKHVLSVYLIDGVTGLILYSNCHKKAKGPVNLVHSENWLVYSYFNERFRRTEIVSAELYEGLVQSNSTVFSSHAVSQLPHVQTQAYILPAHPLTMAVTLTERGITNKFILMALSNEGVTEIPWLLLQPRFANIACGPEESCIPYMPEVPLPPEAVINYNQTIGRIAGIEVAPARLESTSHVLIHGLDLFYTRVAPSKSFDVLKEDFDYNLILFVLTGLIVASYITKHLASQKALKQVWK